MAFAQNLRNHRRAAIAVVALVVATCEGAAVLRDLRKPAMAGAPLPDAVTEHVGLDVQPEGKALRLSWDLTAAPAREATRALLHIEDGKRQILMNLDAASVASGALLYQPKTDAVEFRLELFTPRQTAVERIRSVKGQSTQSAAEMAPIRLEALSEAEAGRTEGDSGKPSPFAPPKPGRLTALSAKQGDAAMAARAVPLRDVVVPLPSPSLKPASPGGN